jgi:hypothetical protein
MMTAISSCTWLFIFVYCCIKGGLLLLFARVEHHRAAVMLLSIIPVLILCAHGELGEQASRTGIRIGSSSRVCVDDQVFGKHLRDCSPFSSSSERLHLLPGGALSSSDRLLLLPSGRSRDGTTYIFVTTQKSTHRKYQIQIFSQNFHVMMSVMYRNPTYEMH